MKRIISNADSIIAAACGRYGISDKDLYSISKRLLVNCQKYIDESREKQGISCNNIKTDVISIMENVLHQLRHFPGIGDLYAGILRLNYLSNADFSARNVQTMIGMGETSFFTRKKQAIMSFGLTLMEMIGKDNLMAACSQPDLETGICLIVSELEKEWLEPKAS